MRCAVIGGGVIGGGWAARFVLNGMDTTVFDPHPDTERRVCAVLANATRAQQRLTMAPPGPMGTLRFVESVADAVQGAGLVQENAPEREDLKCRLLQEIDACADPEALICSSTSGLLPTRLQAGMRRPGRFVVAHPFNPVYLLPLVELCGGAATSATTIERARGFYTSLGMRPLHVRTEIDGFLADRLLEALWREALWLVHDGVATVAEVDDAVRFGAGLRWAFMGTFLTYRLAGGEDGMRHFMQQFGPALKLPWTRLMDVPELTDAFIDRLTEQSDDQAGGLDLRTLERKRDDCLVAILQALKVQDFGAGAVLAAHERVLFDRAHVAAEVPDPVAPLHLHQATVLPEWTDYNGHMTESRYLQVFGDATDALLRHVGATAAYLASGFSFYTVETHINHLKEIAAGEALEVTSQVLDADPRRLHVFHRMLHSATGALLATGEHLLLHVDTRAGRAAPAAEAMAGTLTRLARAQAGLPRPEQAGRHVGARREAAHVAAFDRLLDPQVKAFIARTDAFYPPSAGAGGPVKSRAHYDRMCAAFRRPRPDSVSVSDDSLGALRRRHYTTADSRPGLALLYLHGGGFVVGGLDSHDDVCAEICASAGIDVTALDYRLAPEHPYPAALDDTEAAFESLAIDGKRVIVCGDSAGGNLAAAVCIRRKRAGRSMPAGQVLIYPGLGGDANQVSPPRNAFAPGLGATDVAMYNRIYAGGADRIPRDDPEFAPLFAADHAGLPPAAIFAAGADPLRQDAEDYAALLNAAGVAVDFRLDPGLVHGWLRGRHDVALAGRAFAAILNAIRELA